ncbi:3-ketoacyl-CoA synthase 7 [Linum perenne]
MIFDEFSFLLSPKPLALLALITVGLYYYYCATSSSRVYLVDFMCFKGPKTHRVPTATFVEHAALGKFGSDTVEFQTKVIERSGIGEMSYMSTGMHHLPPNTSLEYSVEELEVVLFTTVKDLLTKLDVDPKDIGFVITNCSLVSLTPSLSSMVVNRFGFRSDVKSYNISGMALSLAQDMLRVHENSMALVVSMEAMCESIYQGKVKSMLLANCLFRMGGVAALLSNRKTDKNTAKYELQHLVTTHMGFKDLSYKCVFQENDKEGYTGVALSKSILQVASEGLKTNLATLAAVALPYSELIKYGLSKMWPKKGGPLYKPNFKKAFDHFCIHAGGKAVIDAIKKNLKLQDNDVEASRMTLHRFGNTSSSSIWYSFGYLEAKGRIKEGDKVWQIGFGSGFKCNSAVWKCISKVKSDHWNVWSDCIDEYPLEITENSNDH